MTCPYRVGVSALKLSLTLGRNPLNFFHIINISAYFSVMGDYSSFRFGWGDFGRDGKGKKEKWK